MTEEHHHHHAEGGSVGIDFWINHWASDEGKECHVQSAHECLVKYQDLLLKGKENAKIFVPLCGKTYDMKWLADRGHVVVGIDCSPDAIKQFFELNHLTYEEKTIPEIEGRLFQTQDKKIRLYVCDFFKFNAQIEKDFDGVWDAAALHALHISDHQRYVDVVKPMMKPTCQYLVEDIIPTCTQLLSKAELEQIFGAGYNVVDLGFTKTDVDFYKDYGTSGFNMYHIYHT